MQTQVLSLLIGFLFGVETLTSPSTELPQRYFRLMEAELLQIEKQLATEGAADPKALKTSRLPGALLAAAVLYTRDHPANPVHGDHKKLTLALKLGDLLATENEQGRFTQLLNHNWGTYFWLEAYRLLEKNLGEGRATATHLPTPHPPVKKSRFPREAGGLPQSGAAPIAAAPVARAAMTARWRAP